ncbi:MAG: Maf family nucleotide pyrophosphatase [Pseudomonadota bacterium]|nr:Maf family nucleotide pyrophosphatase [Pseudomonadota bacterium]
MPNHAPAAPPELLLGSASKYRAELLARLRLGFRAVPSAVDETPLAGEAPHALARRLSVAKARAVQVGAPQAWILGSDQTAVVAGRITGKPGGRVQQIEQLQCASGQTVEFLTGLALLTPAGLYEGLDVTTVRFRRLSQAEIEHYVDAEPAYDCAGGFKCEGLGISLFDAIESTDPTGLVGLPLILTHRLLRDAGYPF